MTDLRERLNNLKIAVACTLSEPMEEDDLNDILKSIDSIFPETYISEMEEQHDRQRINYLYFKK